MIKHKLLVLLSSILLLACAKKAEKEIKDVFKNSLESLVKTNE